MPKAIRIHEYGGPEVLRWEEVEVGDPGPGGRSRSRSTAGPSCRRRTELHRRLSPHRPVSVAIAALDAGHGRRWPGRGGGRGRHRIQVWRPGGVCQPAGWCLCRGPADSHRPGSCTARYYRRPDRRRHDVARDDRAISIAAHLSGAAWRCDLAACRCRRRRADRQPMGAASNGRGIWARP